MADLGALAAAVAHELRNPLAAINIAAQNIRRKKQDLPIDRHLESIEKKVLESDQIITNLLFCSKVRLPHFEPVDLKDILVQSIHLAQKRFHGQNVQIIEKFPKNKMIIQADPTHLKELFNNILNNAFDAVTQHKKGQVVIGLRAKPKNLAEISFKDNGEGISPENLKKIQDSFFTTKAKAAGLGLTVCRQITKSHNGKIAIRSRAGKGASIVIDLPRNSL